MPTINHPTSDDHDLGTDTPIDEALTPAVLFWLGLFGIALGAALYFLAGGR